MHRLQGRCTWAGVYGNLEPPADRQGRQAALHYSSFRAAAALRGAKAKGLVRSRRLGLGSGTAPPRRVVTNRSTQRTTGMHANSASGSNVAVISGRPFRPLARYCSEVASRAATRPHPVRRDRRCLLATLGAYFIEWNGRGQYGLHQASPIVTCLWLVLYCWEFPYLSPI
jgi:hypothetical protein